MGGIPPPLNGKSAKLFRIFFPKRTKNDVFVLNKVKNGPKRPNNRPKGLRMYEERHKIEFSDQKKLFLAEFSLAELGGTPP